MFFWDYTSFKLCFIACNIHTDRETDKRKKMLREQEKIYHTIDDGWDKKYHRTVIKIKDPCLVVP